MTTKQLLIALMGTGLPKGEIRQEMFAFYNSKVGTGKYFMKKENPKTACGSCIQRVKTNIWKWYHEDEKAPNYKGFVFTGRLVAHNMPLYKYEDGKKE
jgi:NAD-dependent dihydropyrimidine dehydrogenase PreA subunit